MFRRATFAALLLAATASAGLAQQAQPVPQPQAQGIPQPNEVAAPDQPEAAAQEAVVTGPPRPDGLRFGGDDGVFRFVVIGDGMAQGLGAGLERLTELDPRFEAVTRINGSSGLARREIYDWPSAAAKILRSSKFDAVFVFMGLNDRQPIKTEAGVVEFGTPEWAAAYKQRIESLLSVVTAAGARTYWITLPQMQDGNIDAQIQQVSALQREEVAAAGATLIDIRPPLSNADGSFMIGDLDANGKLRKLRTKDGIGFSNTGNTVLAGLVFDAVKQAEHVADLQQSGAPAAEQQVAMAQPVDTSSPIFGQAGSGDTDVTFAAEALAKEVPQQIAPDVSNAGKLGLKIARGSLAQRFYRTGLAAGVPYGRFDDFSVNGGQP
ncbi:MAG: DUF459 domain-containing protein [Hyphomicrobiales bacterium]